MAGSLGVLHWRAKILFVFVNASFIPLKVNKAPVFFPASTPAQSVPLMIPNFIKNMRVRIPSILCVYYTLPTDVRLN